MVELDAEDCKPTGRCYPQIGQSFRDRQLKQFPGELKQVGSQPPSLEVVVSEDEHPITCKAPSLRNVPIPTARIH